MTFDMDWQRRANELRAIIRAGKCLVEQKKSGRVVVSCAPKKEFLQVVEWGEASYRKKTQTWTFRAEYAAELMVKLKRLKCFRSVEYREYRSCKAVSDLQFPR